MREIGTIVDERQARALADYLLTLNITTKVEPRTKGDGFAVWVHREDRVPEARAALADFEANPSDVRFRAAAKTAREIRKEGEKVEAQHRKLSRDLRDRWEGAMYGRAPLAFALIMASIVVTALIQFQPQVRSALSFSTYSVHFVDDEPVFEDTGFDRIKSGQVWRLITPIFLHFGILHLFFNMVAMRVLGERVEMRKGTCRFALLVLASALVGNVGQFFLTGGGFGGMSGVIFAIAGYLWVKGQGDPGDGLSLDNQSFNYMLIWFSLGFLAPILMPDAQGFPFNMANVAHGGGLAVGVLFGLLRF